MFVRVNTLHGDKGQVDSAVEFVEGMARQTVEAAAGNRGMATAVDREAGVTFVASYWESADAMRDSEPAVSEPRERAGVVGGGDVTVERYELGVGQRLSMPEPGAPVRILRMEGDPSRTDETAAFYRDEVLPRLLRIAGVCVDGRGRRRRRPGAARRAPDPGGRPVRYPVHRGRDLRDGAHHGPSGLMSRD